MNSQANEKDSAGAWQLSLQSLLLIAVGIVVAITIAAVLIRQRESVIATIRNTLGPPLKSLHAPLDRALDAVPMSVAQGCTIGLFVAAAIFAWCMPRRYIYLGAPDQARWRDLRIWATLVLVPYMIIYYWLGI
jgi:uncharacterized membrane protein YgaE (UPF0421/DUF939 family)